MKEAGTNNYGVNKQGTTNSVWLGARARFLSTSSAHLEILIAFRCLGVTRDDSSAFRHSDGNEILE